MLNLYTIRCLFIKEVKIFFGTYLSLFVFGGVAFLNSLFVLILNLDGRTNYNDALIVIFISLMITIVIAMLTVSSGCLTEEKNQWTLELLFTLPLTDFEIIFSKLLFGFFLCFINTFFINLFFPILLLFLWDIPIYFIVSSSLGVFLLGCFTYSIGVLASSIAKNQMIALIFAISILFSLWLVGYFSHLFQEKTRDILFHFHIFSHYINFTRGILPLKSIVFFLSGIALNFYLSIKVLESRRWQG